MLCMPTHRDLSVYTANSLFESHHILAQRGIELDVTLLYGSSIVEVARNKCVHLFLQSERNRLIFIDSDITWNPADLVKLLALSTKLEVVGASYPRKADPLVFAVQGFDVNDGVTLGEYGCIDCGRGGFGLGFTVIQRKVIEELAAEAPTTILPDMKDTPIPEIFRDGSVPTARSTLAGADGEFTGEDMNFFYDVYDLGYKVWMDPHIRLGHVGPKVFEASFLDMLKPVTSKET